MVKRKISFGLSDGDFLIRKDNRIVIHKLYKKNDFSVGTIHKSRSCGYYKVVNIHPERASNGQKIVDIEFLATGTKKTILQGNLNSGSVKDDELYKLCVGKKYTTRFGNEMTITSVYNNKETGFVMATYKFDDCDILYTSRLVNIMNGEIHDTLKSSDNLYLHKTFTNDFGEYTVIDKVVRNNKTKYIVKFSKTGYTTETTSSYLRTGAIRDPYYPTVNGIGYLGEGYTEFRENDRELYDTLIRRWMLMMDRCYNSKSNNYPNYGKKGVTVSERWHNLSNYVYDVVGLENFDRAKVISGKLKLDKDFKQLNIDKKVYSKDTCIWLTDKENNPYIVSTLKDVKTNKNHIKW